MSKETPAITPAEELVNAVKHNLLKPMYEGINKNTNETNEKLKNDLLEKLNDISKKIDAVSGQHNAFVEAFKTVKWDL